MTDEETRAAERLALLRDADGFLKTITTKHDIEIANRLRSILVDLNAIVDVAEAEATRYRVDIAHILAHRVHPSDKAIARLRDEVAALKHENAQLRNGEPKGADPVALFDRLNESVGRLAARMKVAKIEEGGLYCGGCGANIAENAEGVQALRDRIAELEASASNLADEPKDWGTCCECRAPLTEDGCSVNADHIPF